MKRKDIEQAVSLSIQRFLHAGICLREEELDQIEATDFGLDDWRIEGAQILTLVSTSRVGLKLICLLPGQHLPEHWHEAFGDAPGKEETLRCLWGNAVLCTTGTDTMDIGVIPDGKTSVYTCRHEHQMKPSDQITLKPGSRHWMQGTHDGTVLMSVSTMATCDRDPFTDTNVIRFPPVED